MIRILTIHVMARFWIKPARIRIPILAHWNIARFSFPTYMYSTSYNKVDILFENFRTSNLFAKIHGSYLHYILCKCELEVRKFANSMSTLL
jgi:hypothetical protein